MHAYTRERLGEPFYEGIRTTTWGDDRTQIAVRFNNPGWSSWIRINGSYPRHIYGVTKEQLDELIAEFKRIKGESK